MGVTFLLRLAALALAVLAPGDLRGDDRYLGPQASWPAPQFLPGALARDVAPLQIPARPRPGSPEFDLAALGAALFDDPLLSASGHFSCESCHHRSLAFADGLPRAFGHGRAEGRRNAIGLTASAFQPQLFWDGRASTLEEQALAPLLHPEEMANPSLADVAARVAAAPQYNARFQQLNLAVTPENIALALAAFQRGLTRTTPFDRFLDGSDTALDATARRGLHLFRTKAGCINCHNGPLLSDGGFHNLGLGFPGGRLEDIGRAAVTGNPQDAGRFRTPALRDLGKTAPYMHNGIFPSLEGVVNFYRGGGGRPGAGQADPPQDAQSRGLRSVSDLLQPLELTDQDVADLVAFLRRL